MMNKKTELMSAIDSLLSVCKEIEYDSAKIPERLDTLDALDKLDFDDLLQSLRHHAQTVYAYTAEGVDNDIGCRYFGLELFPCRATLLYSENVLEEQAVLIQMNRVLELWLLDDFRFALVANTAVDFTGGVYRTAYRVVRSSNLKEIAQEMNLDLDQIGAKLMELADSYCEKGIPTYEL